MKAVTLFSGIGGVACGMKMAGIDVVDCVEFDADNSGYSRQCQEVHALNFDSRSTFYLSKVSETVDSLPECDILQSSPVCKNFSAAVLFNRPQQETAADIAMAQDTVKAIARCNPRHFFLEQVPAYQNSRSIGIIIKALWEGGYKVVSDIVDVADYGIPQNRKRFFLLATRASKSWQFPTPVQKVVGWKEAIAGIRLEPSHLTGRQFQALVSKLDTRHDLSRGVLIQRIGLNVCVRNYNEPCWTITRSSFVDGKGGARENTINVVDFRGAWKLPIRAIARLCGFPDSYILGDRFVGEGLGYSCPPRFICQLIKTLPHSDIRVNLDE